MPLQASLAQGLYYDSGGEKFTKKMISKGINDFLFQRHATNDKEENTIRKTLAGKIIEACRTQLSQCLQSRNSASEINDRVVELLAETIRNLIRQAQDNSYEKLLLGSLIEIKYDYKRAEPELKREEKPVPVAIECPGPECTGECVFTNGILDSYVSSNQCFTFPEQLSSHEAYMDFLKREGTSAKKISAASKKCQDLQRRIEDMTRETVDRLWTSEARWQSVLIEHQAAQADLARWEREKREEDGRYSETRRIDREEALRRSR